MQKSKSQIARENGSKSKGPKTPEGKEKSKYNALRHGFTSHKAVLLDHESETELQEFSEIYFTRYQPADDAEALLVEEVIACAWRLRRLWHTESVLMDIEIARMMATNQPSPIQPLTAHVKTALAFQSLTASPANSAAAQAVGVPPEQANPPAGGQLMLLQRYARSLRLQQSRALRELEALQSQRKQPIEPTPLPSAPQPDTHQPHTPIPQHPGNHLHPRNRSPHP